MRNMYGSQRGKYIELGPYIIGHLPRMYTTTAAVKWGSQTEIEVSTFGV